MLKQTITAMIALTAALTFCGCKSADSPESNVTDSKSMVSSSSEEQSISTEDTSADNKSSDESSDDVISLNSDPSPDNPEIGIITEDTISDNEMPIVSEDNTDNSSLDNIIIGDDASSENENSSGNDSEDGHGIDEIELPIVLVDP